MENKMIYGTAWKQGQTKELVLKAIRAGFRGIDTACQPKHYQEALVGDAIASALQSSIISSRSDLFIQTKFTAIDGQDLNRVPYDQHAPLIEQVRQSIAKSLENLKLEYIDSMLLHSPMESHTKTMQVWRTMEEFVHIGKIRQLGISNCYDFKELMCIWNDAIIKPKVLQNRFYRNSRYDKEIRIFCRAQDIQYQSFWSLTANPQILNSPSLESIRNRLEGGSCEPITREQVFYRFLIKLGITPLNGTTNEQHMKEDLCILQWSGENDLSDQEVHGLEKFLI